MGAEGGDYSRNVVSGTPQEYFQRIQSERKGRGESFDHIRKTGTVIVAWRDLPGTKREVCLLNSLKGGATVCYSFTEEKKSSGGLDTTGFPPPPWSKLVFSSESGDGSGRSLALYEAQGSVAELQRFYTEQVADTGWVRLQGRTEKSLPDDFMCFSRGSENCFLQIRASEKRVFITLIVEK